MRNLTFSIVAVLVILVSGCSSGGSLTTPDPGDSSHTELNKLSGNIPIGVTEFYSDGSPSAGMGTLGLFQIHLDSDNLTGELISMRQGMLPDVLEVVDITNFLQLAPCTDCVKLQSVALDDDGNLVVSIGIKHPFDPGDPFKPPSGRNRGDLHVFNVEGIVISNNPATSFPGIGKSTADFRLLNASGYTGYLNSVINEFYSTSATIHPYILHFDDYSQGNFDPNNPMGFDSVTIPPPSGNLVMAMGSDYDFKDYIFDIAGETLDFIYAVGCTYAVSAASINQRFTPEYRIPQHNKKAASEVWVDIVSNDLAGEDTESSATLRINVVDISHGVQVGDALDEMLADSSVSGVSVEIPGITLDTVDFSTTPLSGTGHDPADPLVFEGEVTNSAGGDEGTYIGLVKVTDSYLPGLNTSPLLNNMDGIKRVDPIVNPLEGLFLIDEFATYQVFSVVVETGIYLELIFPNGNEEWEGWTNQDIVWNASANITSVDIYYSKDDFDEDVNEIVTDYPNTGLYDWYVPNDPSETVKVKIVAQGGIIEDESDEYFTILEARCHFSEDEVFEVENVHRGQGFSRFSVSGGLQITRQSPTEYLIAKGHDDGGNRFLLAYDTSDVDGDPVASFENDVQIVSNSLKCFIIDSYSEPGIDRIFYQSDAGIHNQLKMVDWNGSEFVNNQTLTKPDSYGIWEWALNTDGDLFLITSLGVNPAFFKYEKATGYTRTHLFSLDQATCDFDTVGNVRGFIYNPVLDAFMLLARNDDVSHGGQIFVIDLNGNLIYEDRNVFDTSLSLDFWSGLYIDLSDPECRILAHTSTSDGYLHFARYSADLLEKQIYSRERPSGIDMYQQGAIGDDGRLWLPARDRNGWYAFILEFNPPDDW